MPLISSHETSFSFACFVYSQTNLHKSGEVFLAVSFDDDQLLFACSMSNDLRVLYAVSEDDDDGGDSKLDLR